MRFPRTSSLSWILSALAVIGYASAEAQTVFPREAWEYVEKEALENHGWSAEVLAKTTEFIRDESNTTGLVIVDRGRVVYRYGDIEELSYVASVRKSILAMLYGYWVENGIIDLETTLEELGMDDIGGLLPIEKKATGAPSEDRVTRPEIEPPRSRKRSMKVVSTPSATLTGAAVLWSKVLSVALRKKTGMKSVPKRSVWTR